MTQRAAEDVRPANGQTSSQINTRLHASQDQRLTADAEKEDQLMDTHAVHAQLDKLLIQTTPRDA